MDILKLTDNREKHGGFACMLGYRILQWICIGMVILTSFESEKEG